MPSALLIRVLRYLRTRKTATAAQPTSKTATDGMASARATCPTPWSAKTTPAAMPAPATDAPTARSREIQGGIAPGSGRTGQSSTILRNRGTHLAAVLRDARAHSGNMLAAHIRHFLNSGCHGALALPGKRPRASARSALFMIVVKTRAYTAHFYREKNSFRDHGGGGETVWGAGADLGDMRARSAAAVAFAASA
jgi:hypothetical protein